jgi:DNA-binding transcriptional LysR family regulator
MVLAGLGVALLPRSAVGEELAAGQLRAIEIVGTQPIERRIVAVRRNDPHAGPRPPAADAFWDLLPALPTP